jgi:hypothetical protein
MEGVNGARRKEITHADGLSVPLKSDNAQAQDAIVISSFDFVIDEQCN